MALSSACLSCGEYRLLYIGISPSSPPANGKEPSKQSLQHRLPYHYRGNAEGSTLRLTLGCLLANQLGIELRCVGSIHAGAFNLGLVCGNYWEMELREGGRED